MRYIPLIFILLTCLLLPSLSYAQDQAPVIARSPFDGHSDIFALYQGKAPQRLAQANWTELYLSPDSRKIAYLNLPLFAAEQIAIEPGYYPSDLLVLDIATSAVMPLVAHGDTEPDTLIFSGTGPGPSVETPGAWDDPGSRMFGSRLFANVAWSPDSRSIAHLQSVVNEGKYQSPTTRLVTFDVETGHELLIAEFSNGISQDETGYAVFWFDVGIVLYRDPPEGNSSIHIYNPLGEPLYMWEVRPSYRLSHENPVHYQGKDYLQFDQRYLYDVSTGTDSYVEGTLAMVSAAHDDSLVIEACSDSSTLDMTWDVYNLDNEKVLQVADSGPLALSPNGQQLVYITRESIITIFDGKDTFPYEDDAQNPFKSLDPVWGAMIYIITPIGMQDCRRTPAG